MINKDSPGLSPTQVDVIRAGDKLLNPLRVVAGTLHLSLNATDLAYLDQVLDPAPS